MTVPATPESATALLKLDLEANSFATDWRHCDQIANYLARLASFGRVDTFLHSNLLSTVLNELLEIIYFRHKPEGFVGCTLFRAGCVDRIEFEVPIDGADRSFYETSVAASQSGKASELYTRSLLGDLKPDRSVGFLELAADYGAQIHILPDDRAGVIRFSVDVNLEENAVVPATAA